MEDGDQVELPERGRDLRRRQPRFFFRIILGVARHASSGRRSLREKLWKRSSALLSTGFSVFAVRGADQRCSRRIVVLFDGYVYVWAARLNSAGAASPPSPSAARHRDSRLAVARPVENLGAVIQVEWAQQVMSNCRSTLGVLQHAVHDRFISKRKPTLPWRQRKKAIGSVDI